MPKPAMEPLTAETRALVDELREHREALETLLSTGEQPSRLQPSIMTVLDRAIARLVLLDTRLESLKRRKPETSAVSATAADRPEKP
jgi:hypothetical protein